MSTNQSGQLPEDRVQALLRRTLELYQRNFTRVPAARTWLAKRGITDLSLADRYRIGWGDGQLVSILPNDSELRGMLATLGLLSPKGRERYSQCVVVPVLFADGQIANLVGISADGTCKALPSRPLPPWNLAATKASPTLWLTSSILDGLAMVCSGHANVFALDPRSGEFDPEPLRRSGVQRVTMVQGDTPAALAATQSLQAKLAGYPAGVVTLPNAEGALAVLAAQGAKQLGELLTANEHGVAAVTVPGMQPLPGGLTLTIANRRYEIRGIQAAPSKLKATVRSERGGKVHVDTLDFYVARARRQLVIDLIRLHAESVDTIEADVTKLLGACELRVAQPDLTSNSEITDQIPEADRREAEAMGKDPKLIETILLDYEQCGLVGERTNKLLSYLAMTSRKMPRPLAILNLSSSGSGKSALQDATYGFCPPEEAVRTTNLSAKALFHRERDSLKHKFLVLEEGKGVESAAYALRVLISSGELITEVATKDPTSGRLVAMRNRVEGPVAVSLTTTSPDTDAETRSRFFVISADESREQTEAILELQRVQHTLHGLIAADERTAIQRRHHAFQRMLQPMRVINPLVHRLAGLSSRLTARRDQPKILGLVSAVAFLRQMAKPIKQHGSLNYIEVDEADLRIATELIPVLTGPGAQEVSRPGRELLAALLRMRKEASDAVLTPEGDFTFTRRAVREFAGWERTRVHRYLGELLDLEYVIRDRTRRGMTDRYVLAWEGEHSFGPADNILPFDGLCLPASAAAGGK